MYYLDLTSKLISNIVFNKTANEHDLESYFLSRLLFSNKEYLSYCITFNLLHYHIDLLQSDE